MKIAITPSEKRKAETLSVSFAFKLVVYIFIFLFQSAPNIVLYVIMRQNVLNVHRASFLMKRWNVKVSVKN